MSRIGRPLICRTRSPGCNPARSAGLPGSTAETTRAFGGYFTISSDMAAYCTAALFAVRALAGMHACCSRRETIAPQQAEHYAVNQRMPARFYHVGGYPDGAPGFSAVR